MHIKAAYTLYLNRDELLLESFLNFSMPRQTEWMLSQKVNKMFQMIQISLHFIHNSTITATSTNPYSKWQEETRRKKSTLVGISPKSPPDSCSFLVKEKKKMSVYISICVCIIYLSTHPSITLSIISITIIYLLFIYHYSSTYLSILLIFANITTQRKP